MAAEWIEQLTGSFKGKERYRNHKARVRQLPRSHREAVEALDRYLIYRGMITNGEVLVSMLGDLLDLFEQGAANGSPVREIIGDDPVEFAELFARNYSEGQWINKERERLISAIDRAAGDRPSGAGSAAGAKPR